MIELIKITEDIISFIVLLLARSMNRVHLLRKKTILSNNKLSIHCFLQIINQIKFDGDFK